MRHPNNAVEASDNETRQECGRKRKVTTTPTPAVPPQKKRKQSCPIEGCDHVTNKLKWHVYYHFPDFCRISRTTEFCQLDFRKLQAKSLDFLCKAILGETATVNNLVEYVNQRWQACDLTIASEIEAEMRALSIQEGWTDVLDFSLCPVNSPAALIHWRPLCLLFNRLSKS